MKVKIKGQLSVFILIALFIIILLIFLINVNFDEKREVVEKDKVKLSSNTGDEFLILKNNVDHCLDMQLKKAVIISGMRGGFIYEKGEYYFEDVNLQNTYIGKFISNLGIDWNFLHSKVLVQADENIYIPSVNESLSQGDVLIYNHSIEDDITKFMIVEFMKCFDLKNQDIGYEINYTDYLGYSNLQNFFLNEVYIHNMEADIGDIVEIVLGNKVFSGVINRSLNDVYIAKFENLEELSSYDAQILQNLTILNLNKTPDLKVNINLEDISANLRFPVTIKNQGFENAFLDSNVFLNVRYLGLLKLSEVLLRYKYMYNKSADYNNNEDILIALNRSEYYKNTELRDFSIQKTIIVDEMEHKKYVYSIIDKNSKILGNPFILNFAYENLAPLIDWKLIDPNLEISNDTITFITSKNYEFRYDLKDYTNDRQLWDNFILYFYKEDYVGSDAEFSLNEKGSLRFMPFNENIYNYPVKVSDGETIRIHNLKFIVGFPDNTNNSAADECFSFKNYYGGPIYNIFPIEDEFKNQKFSYINEENKHIVYGYGIPSSKSEITFSQSCVYNTNLYKAEYSINDGSFEDIDFDAGGIINIFNPSVETKINVTVKQKSNGAIMTESYIFNYYPASCLGPAEEIVEGFESNSFTCCNLDPVFNSINNNQPQSFNNILSSGIALDENFYFALDYENVVLSQVNVWVEFGEKITSLFEAKVTSTCKGFHPTWEMNIDDIVSVSSSDFQGDIKSIEFGGINMDIERDFKLKLAAETAGMCKFAFIENEFLRINLKDGLSFVGGPFEVNSNPLISPIPSSGEDFEEELELSNLFILCDDNWYGKDDNDWIFISGLFGIGGDAKSVEVGKKYCARGSNQCVVRENSPSYEKKSDVKSTCTDWYFNPVLGELFSQGAPNNWQCKIENKQVQCKELVAGEYEERGPVYYNYDLFCNGLSVGINACNNDIEFNIDDCKNTCNEENIKWEYNFGC